MIKILIVDDDPDKARRVIELVRETSGANAEEVNVAYNARDARVYLAKTEYDLLILDIALPEWAGAKPDPYVGLGLLREVCDRRRYLLPKQIVGLTAYSEAMEQAWPEFRKQLWHVIRYDPTATDWLDQLQRKVKYLVLAATNREAVEYGCELCVITALQVPEQKAVLDIPWNWQKVDLPAEVANFFSGSFTAGGVQKKVVATCAPRMGMTAAAVLTTKAIYNFRPRFVAMVGIAAGIRGECGFGDIVVADPIWDYGSGKWASRGSKTIFEIAPHQLPLNAGIRSKFELMSQDASLLARIRSNWPADKPDTALKLHIAPAASGSAVRADGMVVTEVKAQHRKATAIEMEGYGVMAAAHEAPVPEVRAFVAKAVCDFADKKKSDKFQAYAAYTSASILREFAEQHMASL